MNLADVVRRHGPAYLHKYGARMPQSHRRALDAILRCHTPAQGGSLYACDQCGARRFAYHRWLALDQPPPFPSATSAATHKASNG